MLIDVSRWLTACQAASERHAEGRRGNKLGES